MHRSQATYFVNTDFGVLPSRDNYVPTSLPQTPVLTKERKEVIIFRLLVLDSFMVVFLPAVHRFQLIFAAFVRMIKLSVECKCYMLSMLNIIKDF